MQELKLFDEKNMKLDDFNYEQKAKRDSILQRFSDLIEDSGFGYGWGTVLSGLEVQSVGAGTTNIKITNGIGYGTTGANKCERVYVATGTAPDSYLIPGDSTAGSVSTTSRPSLLNLTLATTPVIGTTYYVYIRYIKQADITEAHEETGDLDTIRYYDSYETAIVTPVKTGANADSWIYLASVLVTSATTVTITDQRVMMTIDPLLFDIVDSMVDITASNIVVASVTPCPLKTLYQFLVLAGTGTRTATNPLGMTRSNLTVATRYASFGASVFSPWVSAGPIIHPLSLVKTNISLSAPSISASTYVMDCPVFLEHGSIVNLLHLFGTTQVAPANTSVALSFYKSLHATGAITTIGTLTLTGGTTDASVVLAETIDQSVYSYGLQVGINVTAGILNQNLFTNAMLRYTSA